MLLGGELLRALYKKALESERPLLDIINEIILRKTAGLDALKPACFITALNLRMATQGSPPDKLDTYEVPVGVDRAGSLDLLTIKRRLLLREVQLLGTKRYDVVIMNPPFTRSDRISYLIGEDARRTLLSTQLCFGSARVSQLFTAGMAKPFMVLADKLVKEGGRIAAVLPNSILSRPSWKDIRKELLKSYNIEYIVISWAPGTPSFSSDTLFREILLVVRKRDSSKKEEIKPLRIVNLYKRVDNLTVDDVERIVKRALITKEDITNVVDNNGSVIASIVSINLEKEIMDRLRNMGCEGTGSERRFRDEVDRFSDNLYRLVALRSASLLKLHLDLVIKCGIKLGEVFSIGSVIDHTSGLTRIERNEIVSLPYEASALWGSGRRLNVSVPWLEKAPFRIGVTDENLVRVKYWKEMGRTFYRAKIFMPRKVQLDTQYVLMVRIDEDSVSNVWWPLRPKDEAIATKYLVYMNSIFGFINLLGERLETRGLYMEFKKNHLENMPVLDLRKVRSPAIDIINSLRSPMPRFDQYIKYMAKLNEKMSWYDVARTVIEKAKEDSNLRPYANRAILDLESFRMLSEVCQDINVPSNLYVLLREEISILQQIMEHSDKDDDIVEDVAEKVKKRVEHVSLDKWLKLKRG